MQLLCWKFCKGEDEEDLNFLPPPHPASAGLNIDSASPSLCFMLSSLVVCEVGSRDAVFEFDTEYTR